MCSQFVENFRLNSQHIRGDLYNQLRSSRIFTLIMNKIFILTPQIMRKIARHNFELAITSHKLHVLHQGRSRCRAKSVYLRPAYLR